MKKLGFKGYSMILAIAIILAIFSGYAGSYIGDVYVDACTLNIPKYCCYYTDTQLPIGESYNEILYEPCPSGTIQKAMSDCANIKIYTASPCYTNKQNTQSGIIAGLGIIAFIVGFLLKKNKIISNGLFLGGIINIIVAIVIEWSNFTPIMRVVVSGIGLVGFIAFAYWKMK